MLVGGEPIASAQEARSSGKDCSVRSDPQGSTGLDVLSVPEGVHQFLGRHGSRSVGGGLLVFDGRRR